jgi:hypothetical protein
MLLLQSGHWYRSKQALARLKEWHLTVDPHLTPDGFAVLVFDLRGVTSQPQINGQPTIERHPPALVVQARDGHDLMRVEGRDRIVRAEFAPDALGDLEALVEYDHLPESRKDYTVYAKGHKLA